VETSSPQSPPAYRGRALANITIGALLAALGVLLGWQVRSGLAHVDRMMEERSAALHAAAAREIRNVVRFGTARRERLDDVLRAISRSADVDGVLLERRDRALRIVHGSLPSAQASGAGVRLAGATSLVTGPVRIETRGCHADDGHGCSSCGPSCPAAGDGSLDGDYRLVVGFAARHYLELRRSVLWQGLAGFLLLGSLAAALWLFARQTWRAGEMRAALALTAERARSLERLTLVAGGLAHEIKNPLGSLRGFAQLIGEGVAPGSKEAEYASVMVSELDAITRRVDGLRHFARPSPLEHRPCRPAEVVRRIAALLAPDAAARELRIEVELEPPELETLADEDRLRELVVNLVINAIEASPPRGSVRVSLRVEPAGEGEQFVLEVADQGAGIRLEERERVLRPFHSTKPGGLGLGLALAERAVQDHGGELAIAEAPGGGALLRARWPRRRP
jgi:signal transduction histidine kinase